MSDSGLSFSDVDAATRFRDWLGRQINTVVDKIRPLPRYGRVMSFNRFTGKALVLFTGDIEATPCQMSKQVQPRYSSEDNPTLDPDLGDMVRVEGRMGSYYITAVVSGPAFQVSPVIFDPQFQSGGFLNIPSMKWDSYTAGLPAVGSTWHLGRWDNTDSFGSDGTGLLEIQIQWTFFTNQVRKYIIPTLGGMTSGGWVKVAPLVDSGPQNGNEYGLEMMVDGTAFELRIRRIAQGPGFTPGGWDVRLQISYDNVAKVAGSELGEEASTEPTRFIGMQNTKEMKGPFLGPLMANPRQAQCAMTGGGQINWDGTTLGWTQSFRLGAMGQGWQAKWGYYEATQPATSTSIPVYGNPTSSSVTATAGGIPLIGNQALYYEPPWGDTFTSIGTQYRIVDSGRVSYDEFSTPSHWILIAQRSSQSGTPSLKLGTGEQIDHWRNLPLVSPWANWGGTFAIAQYKMIGGRGVTLKGLIQYVSASAPPGNHVFTTALAVDYRPPEQMVFVCKTQGNNTGAAGNIARVDARPDGTFQIVTGDSTGLLNSATPGAGGWLSLNGVTYWCS
jgi:hypothetical protein